MNYISSNPVYVWSTVGSYLPGKIINYHDHHRYIGMIPVSKPSLPSLTTYPMVGVCWSIDEFLMVIPMKITINECYPTK